MSKVITARPGPITGSRRAISLALSAAMALMFVPVVPAQQALAATGTFTDAQGIKWSYSTSGSKATITGYTGSCDNIIIPSAINGYTVTKVAGSFSDLFFDANANSITFPASITAIEDEDELGMFFDGAVDGDGIFFLGEPGDIDLNSLASECYDLVFNVPSSSRDDWESSGSDVDATWKSYDAPTAVQIQLSGSNTTAAEIEPGATISLAAVNTPVKTTYKSYHTKITWTSSNTSAMTVNATTGKVTCLSSATAGATSTITATNAIGQSASCKVTVVEPAPTKTDIATGCTFSPDTIEDIYSNNGNPAIPEVAVTDKATGNSLAEGADYTVSYKQGESVLAAAPTVAGSYTMVIEGAGENYEGTKEIPFNITDSLALDGWLYAPNADGETAVIKGCTSTETGTLVMPAYIAGLKVTSVDANALSGTAASTLVVPDTVKVLGAGSLASSSCTVVRFMGAAPSAGAGALASGTKLEVFNEHKQSFINAFGEDAKISISGDPWVYYTSINASGELEGTLGANGSNYAYHGETGTAVDLVLPTEIDGVPMSVLGDYCLYGDNEGLAFKSVTIPACYKALCDVVFLDLDCLVVFQGAALEKRGNMTVGDNADNIELYCPSTEQASWSAISWASPTGYYDPTWEGSRALDGYAVISGYNGSDTDLVTPDTYLGRNVRTLDNARIDASNLSSATISRSVTAINGNLFANLDCDVKFVGAPPSSEDCSAAFKGANGASWSGTLYYPAAYAAEWKASPWADAYKCEMYAACNAADYTYRQTDEGLLITGYKGTDSSIQIPSHVDNLMVGEETFTGDVIGIANNAFEQKGIAGVIIPGSVKTIGSEAFWKCTQLRSVVMEEGVESIGDHAFWYCYKLERVDLPASLKQLGKGVFISSALKELNVAEGSASFSSEDGVLFNADKTALICYPMGRTQTSYTVPAGVKVIGEEAFRGEYDDVLNKLQTVVLPDGLESIEWRAFCNAEGLTSLEIPDSVTSIATYAFDSAGSLAKVKLPAGCAEIPEGLFQFNSALTSVTIPVGVKKIGASAFMGTSLTQLVLPEGLTEIGEKAFDGCSSIESIQFPSTLEVVGANAFNTCKKVTELNLLDTNVSELGAGAFAGMEGLTSVVIPNTVTKMGDAVFMQCYNLADVTFEEGTKLTELPMQTFAWDAIAQITIPAEIQSVGQWAFYKCTELTDIVFLNQGAWTLDPLAFEGIETEIQGYGYTDSSTSTYFTEGTFHPIDVVITDDLAVAGTLIPGAEVQLSAGAVTDNGEITYSWYRGEELLGKTTEPVITDTLASEGDVKYRVAIANSFDPTHPNVRTLTVHVGRDIAGCAVAAIPAQTYAGTPLFPLPVVKDGDAILANGTNYTLSYANNDKVGTATITITGKGNYAGTIEVSFVILAASTGGGSTGSGTTPSDPVAPDRPTDPADPTDPTPGDPEVPAAPSVGDVVSDAATLSGETVEVEVTSTDAFITDQGIAVAGTVAIGGLADSTASVVEIPSVVLIGGATYVVTEIPAYAMKGNPFITKLIVPTTVVKIGQSAFEGCAKLASVIVPGSVSVIQPATFRNCASLKSVTLKTGITKIGKSAFSKCSKLKTLTLPSSVKSIDKYAFYKTGIKTLVVKSKKLTKSSVSKLALKSSNITKVKVPKSKLKAYKNIFTKKGCGKTVKVVKD